MHKRVYTFLYTFLHTCICTDRDGYIWAQADLSIDSLEELVSRTAPPSPPRVSPVPVAISVGVCRREGNVGVWEEEKGVVEVVRVPLSIPWPHSLSISPVDAHKHARTHAHTHTTHACTQEHKPAHDTCAQKKTRKENP